ncbi:hypothetical protein ARMGADRAFT_1087904 [Armillaria gallica]|uniref:DUF6534 domain-containing protein n=1 Tax=Armillaria gallica TaxID=47427 RepID=A0A2H3CU68_ARMGA|nr:hypothetical protein ARMGADRAFT_1087904 [Armillaria gallica]
MSSQPSPDIPFLGDTFGALFVGATIGAILFGIINVQMLIYYKRYPNDWSFYRHSVTLFWVLETVHFALGTHALYHYLINIDLRGALEADIIWHAVRRRNSVNLTGYLSFLQYQLQVVIKVWTIVFVQGVYAIRLWKLGRHFHKIIPWLVFIVVGASVGAGIFLSYDLYVPPNLASIFIINRSIYPFFSIIIVADLTIAFMMCYYLYKSRAAIHFSSMAGILLGLMQLVLVSGLATSVSSLVSVFTYIAWPKTLIFLAIDFIIPKLYVNSLIAMFNYRQEHSSKKSTTEHLVPAVLQPAPISSVDHTTETDVSLRPLSTIQDIRSSSEYLVNAKGTIDPPMSQV